MWFPPFPLAMFLSTHPLTVRNFPKKTSRFGSAKPMRSEVKQWATPRATQKSSCRGMISCLGEVPWFTWHQRPSGTSKGGWCDAEEKTKKMGVCAEDLGRSWIQEGKQEHPRYSWRLMGNAGSHGWLLEGSWVDHYGIMGLGEVLSACFQWLQEMDSPLQRIESSDSDRCWNSSISAAFLAGSGGANGWASCGHVALKHDTGIDTTVYGDFWSEHDQKPS